MALITAAFGTENLAGNNPKFRNMGFALTRVYETLDTVVNHTKKSLLL
jgi:hypothetical protein